MDIKTILLFIFIFSILTVSRTVIRLIGSLISNPPKRFLLNNGELIYLGLAISYCLTYIIKY
jgi:hypothetical protein